MEFEWNDAKAAANLRDHGVSFARRLLRAAIRLPSSKPIPLISASLPVSKVHIKIYVSQLDKLNGVLIH